MQLVHVGSNMAVDMETAVAILGKLSAAPTQELIEKARSRGMLVNMTAGLKAKSAIITDVGHVILVHLASGAIVGRLNSPWEEMEASEEHGEEPQHISGSTTSLVTFNIN